MARAQKLRARRYRKIGEHTQHLQSKGVGDIRGAKPRRFEGPNRGQYPSNIHGGDIDRDGITRNLFREEAAFVQIRGDESCALDLRIVNEISV